MIRCITVGIAAKAYYRFHYLRSDHWQNLRIAKLASVNAKCFYCWKRDLSNDVHHLIYRNWRDATLDDLVVLCRECHELYHRVLHQHKDELSQLLKGIDRAVRTIKLVRIAEGKSPKISDHFKELYHSQNNFGLKAATKEWRKSMKARKAIVLLSKPKIKPKIKVEIQKDYCTLCRSERAITIVFFTPNDDGAKRSRLCLSCYIVFLRCSQLRSLFMYSRKRKNFKVPLLEWKKS